LSVDYIVVVGVLIEYLERFDSHLLYMFMSLLFSKFVNLFLQYSYEIMSQVLRGQIQMVVYNYLSLSSSCSTSRRSNRISPCSSRACGGIENIMLDY